MISALHDSPTTIERNHFKHKSLSSWSLNLFMGCGHGCRFCYVPDTSANKQKRLLAAYGVADPVKGWGSYVLVRPWDEQQFMASLSAAEETPLSGLNTDGNRAVFLCSTTDPYQVILNTDSAKQKLLNTHARSMLRRALVAIRDHSTLNVRILTRSPLARKDFDTFKTFGDRLLLGTSLPTLDPVLSRFYEPNAPAPKHRLKMLNDVFTEDGGKLEELLAACTGNQIDIANVKLTAQCHSTRLVAIRASKQESEKRRRELHAQAKSLGKAASIKSLIRADWHLMVTNVPQPMQSVQQLAKLYQQRWQIEIVFRGWKQASQLGKALRRTSSPQHLKGLVLTAMIAMSMSVKLALNLIRHHPTLRYSLEKIFDYMIGQFLKLRNLVDLGKLVPDHRTLKGQKRKRNSLACNILEVLG